MTHPLKHRELIPVHSSAPRAEEAIQNAIQPKKQPFVEPKLTWVEPMLIQQGTLNAAAQSGGFFGSFSP